MRIEDGSNFVELVRVPGVCGDRLVVSVQSHGCSASEHYDFASLRIEAFLEQLRELESTRRGHANFGREFSLTIEAVGRRGHMAVSGELIQVAYGEDTGRAYRHSLMFGFEFDPTSLPRIVADVERLMSHPQPTFP